MMVVVVKVDKMHPSPDNVLVHK